MRRIDINCDMGESFGPWKMGDDKGIMPYVTSANIACGGHAGDPDVMRATVRLAKANGVMVGAHPGYADMRGFGRRAIPMPPGEVTNMLLYQIGALYAVCRAEDVEMRHVKPHGALYNRACEDIELASAVAEAVWKFSKSLLLLGLPGSCLEEVALARGISFVAEGFADRAYEPNGSLRDRRFPDALLTDPQAAAAQAVALADGKATAHNGEVLQFSVASLCIHGDTPGAATIARTVRDALREAGITVAAPNQPPRQ